MYLQTIEPIWNALRNRFQKTVEGLTEEDIHMQLGKTTVGDLLYHTAEVEYLFSQWFFDKPLKRELIRPTELNAYVQLLADSNAHIKEAMEHFPKEDWDLLKQSAFGESTPLEAVGRLMNHTGMHAGQIAYLKKFGQYSEE